MNDTNKKWYLQKGVRVPSHVIPGQPRREVAQEFFSNVLELGRYARQSYLDECKAGTRAFNQQELDELDGNIATVERELAKFK